MLASGSQRNSYPVVKCSWEWYLRKLNAAERAIVVDNEVRAPLQDLRVFLRRRQADLGVREQTAIAEAKDRASPRSWAWARAAKPVLQLQFQHLCGFGERATRVQAQREICQLH